MFSQKFRESDAFNSAHANFTKFFIVRITVSKHDVWKIAIKCDHHDFSEKSTFFRQINVFTRRI